MDMEVTKFKVGDWVKLKGENEIKIRAHILETYTQKCEAGIGQNKYVCRCFVNERNNGWTHSVKEMVFREMEIDKIVQNPFD